MAQSRLTSNAARHAAHASRAFVAQAIRAGRSAAGVGYDAAREAARISSYMAPELVLTATDAGDGTATIHVAEHDRVYPVQGNVKVPNVTIEAADIEGVDLAIAEIYVYYLDTTLSDPTPVLLTTLDRIEATNGAAAGLHFVGKTSTPAAGAPATTGTSGASPTSWPQGDRIDNRYPTP